MNTEDAATVDYKPVEVGNTMGYTSTYEASRNIAKFVSFIGWAVVVLVAISLIIIVPELAKSRYGFNWIKLFPSISICIAGLLVVVAGQVTKATVDNADNTGRILTLLKNKLEQE